MLFGDGPLWSPMNDLAVDGRVREVLVVAELVDQHVERFGRVAEGRPVEEGHPLENVARDGIHPLRPGEPEHAGVRPEQQIEDLAGVVEDDGRAGRPVRLGSRYGPKFVMSTSTGSGPAFT